MAETTGICQHGFARHEYCAMCAYPGPVSEGEAAAPSALLTAINRACAIIEMGDQRLMAADGPCGNQPPSLTLDEWRELYVTLDEARSRASDAATEER